MPVTLINDDRDENALRALKGESEMIPMKFACKSRFLPLLFGLIVLLQADCMAQSQNEAYVLYGEGAFLRGLGSYNLNTAKGDSINLDTMIRWKQDLRNDMKLAREAREERESKKKQRKDEVKQQQQLRERQLRENPSPSDIRNGQALNALFYDLTDPAISSNDWMYRPVPMPVGLSVKDLIFSFTPLSTSTEASRALSRGVVALSRLEVEGNQWPTVLKQEELDRERHGFEAAYAKLKDSLLGNKPVNKTVTEMDDSLDRLEKKVKTSVPKERGFRDEALKYVKDLYNATRMFDAATVDYSREILIDTKDHDAATVGELISFMLKYRLQFATAESNPKGRLLYGQVYEALRRQAKAFEVPAPPPESELDRVMRQFGSQRDAARSKLVEAFDQQIKELQNLNTQDANRNEKTIDFVKVEKATFIRNGLIPFSRLMRRNALDYLMELRNAEDLASNEVAKLKNVGDMDELKNLIRPTVVGKWNFTSQLDRNFRFSWTLYSNGTINLGSSKWTLNESGLVGTHPNAKAPGGAWIDSCMIEENGQQLSARNQLGHPFKAVKID